MAAATSTSTKNTEQLESEEYARQLEEYSKDPAMATARLFCDAMEEMVSAMKEVWPTCTGLLRVTTAFNMKTKNVLTGTESERGMRNTVSAWHDAMAPYYTRCQQKDESVFEEVHHPALNWCKFDEKWAEADDDTRDCMWEYINEHLNQYARTYALYATMPPSVVRAVGVGTRHFGETGGQIDIGVMMKAMQDNATPEEIAEFGQRAMSMVDMSQLFAGMGGEGGGLGSLLGGGNTAGLGALLGGDNGGGNGVASTTAGAGRWSTQNNNRQE